MTDYSIIPQTIDGNSTDQYTIGVDVNGKLQIKPTYEANNISNPIAEHECEIMTLQANATITPFTHDTLIADTFSDADGYKNSVTVATTTALYDTTAKKYKVPMTLGATEISTSGLNGVDRNNTTQLGTAKAKGFFSQIVTYATVGGSSTGNVYIYKNGAQIATKGYTSGGTSTINLVASDYTDFFNVGDTIGIKLGSGSGSDGANAGYAGFTGTKFDLNAGATFRHSYTFTEISSTTGTKIDITLPTITGTVIATELIVNCPDTETGASITYKLKNATQNDTNLANNTKNSVVNLTTVPTGIEIFLNPKTNGTIYIPSVKTYCLKLWKA
jgi:hypothetical protein